MSGYGAGPTQQEAQHGSHTAEGSLCRLVPEGFSACGHKRPVVRPLVVAVAAVAIVGYFAVSVDGAAQADARAGRAMLRAWLALNQQGMAVQPMMSCIEAQSRSAIIERDLKASTIRAEQDVVRLKAELALVTAGPRTEVIDAAKMELASAEAEANEAAEQKTRYDDPGGNFEHWPKQLFEQAVRRYEAAAARRDAAKAHLHELEAGSRSEERDRARALLAAAEAEVERLRSTRQLQLDAAQAQVVRAKAELDNAEAELNRTRLTSPVDGTIVWKFLHGGEVVDAMRQRFVLSVADVRRLRVRASVDEADYPRVFPGQQVKVTADGIRDRKLLRPRGTGREQRR